MDDPSRPEARKSGLPLPRSITAIFEALTSEEEPADGTERPRPLLDLFPTERRKSEGGRRTDKLTAYETFYGVREKPFAPSPDPRFFYHSAPHDLVCQRLLSAVRDREGLLVLTGEIGVGKSTLCRVILEELDRHTLMSVITEPLATGEELLARILGDFRVLPRDDQARQGSTTLHELTARLQSFIESLAPIDSSAAVIIDEAQSLSRPVLDQVRTLTEIAEATSRLQVVLVGEPSLGTVLSREHNALQQRITAQIVLPPLPQDEIGSYIRHRLEVAAGNGRVEFDDAAVARVDALTGGVPRLINVLCDRALARGYEASVGIITAAIVDAAARDLELDRPASSVRELAKRFAAVIALTLFVLAGAAIAAWVFRDPLGRAIQRWERVPAAPAPPADRLPAPSEPQPPSPPVR